jgi:Flp pilus assembly protein TadD
LFLYALLRSVESPRRWYAVSVIAFVVGIGCKEVMITAPVVALVFDRIFLAGRWDAIAAGRKMVYVAILPAWLWLWFNAAGGIQSNIEKAGSRAETASARDGGTKSAVIESPATKPDRTDVRRSRLPSPWQYLCTQPRVILHYIHLAFWPRPLCLDYKGGWPISTVRAAVLPGIVVGLLLCATFMALRFSPPIGFLAFSFFVILTPTSSVLPLPDVIFEHRMYLPLAALISIVVFGGGLLADRLPVKISITPKIRARAFGVCCVVVLVSLSAVTIVRNRDYQSRSAIWQSVCGIYPENTRALQQLAAAHLAERNLEKARQVQATLEARTGGNETASGNVFAINTKGRLLMASGDYAAAAGVFAEAVRLAPRDRTLHATVQMNLGVALEKLGRPQKAIERYRIAVKLKPGMVQPHTNLGAALLQMGEIDEAAVELHEAVRLDSGDFQSLTNLGLALVHQKKLGEAVAFFQRAVAAEPQRIRGHDNLASAYIDTGQYAEAMRSLERAKSLATERGQGDYAESIRQRIDRIRGAAAGRP